MKKYFFPSTILQIIITFICSMILATPWLFILNGFSQEIKMLLFLLLLTLTFLIIVHLINCKRNVKISYNLKLTYNNILLLLVAILFIYQYGIHIPVNSFFNKFTPNNSLSFILGAVFVGPILEEIIFRGIILKGLLITYSVKKAIIISSIFFGLIHGELLLIFPAIIIGIFFGWIYYKTKSLGVTIFLHSIANFFTLSGVFLIQKLKIYSSDNLFNMYRITSILISIIVLTFLFKKLSTQSNKTLNS